MKVKKLPGMTGIALAMAAAGLMTGHAGIATAGTSVSTDFIHCSGVNACKGHNDCKTSDNACAGKASCKGSGFVGMPSKACGDIGGTVMAGWKGSVVNSDLVHCYGVNACGGHNDCKTANNACAGKGSCKGTGFVAMTKGACGNVGGKEST